MHSHDRFSDRDAPGSADGPATNAWAALAPSPACCLTSKDYTLLEGHLARIEDGRQPLLAALIRMKLARAAVVLTGDVEPEVATGGSHIVFAMAGEAEQARVLVHWDDNPVLGECLRVTTLLGATLLGMRVGRSAPLLRADGTLARVMLTQITFQPEAARNAAPAKPRGR